MTVADTQCCEVCVVGGGPAGAAVSIRLADLDRDVILLEAEPFPRHRVAATLPPAVLPVLESLHAREEIEGAGFSRFEDVAILWDTERPELRGRPGPLGFHVERARFDALLLDVAERCGVRVIQPVLAENPVRECEGWTVPLRGGGAIKAPIVIEADGGRRASASNRKRLSPNTLALYADWHMATPCAGRSRLEALSDCWLWFAPTGPASAVAAVFADPATLRDRSRADYYHEAVGRSRLVAKPLRDAVAAGVKIRGAALRMTQPAAAKGVLRVGDASVQLDPLSSQGVYTALASSLQAAIAAHSMLLDSESAAAAIEFYTLNQSRCANRHRVHSAGEYERVLSRFDTEFWRRRAQCNEAPPEQVPRTDSLDPDMHLRLARVAQIRNTPVIVGDRIARHPALHHGSLEQPVAFLHNVPLAPLLKDIDGTKTARSLLSEWSGYLPDVFCRKALNWLWEHRIVVPH